MLLGLLAELQGIVVEPLGLSLTIPLQPQSLLADLVDFGHGLLPGTLVLGHQLLVAVGRLLLQLLAPEGKLLLHLGQPGLLLLLSFGNLLTGLGQNLLALEPGLVA